MIPSIARHPRAAALPFERGLENPMHDQIGITADGRSEMGIGLGREREMADVLFRIARLLKRAQHQVGKDALLRLALQALGQPLVVPRADLQFFRLHSLEEARVAVALVALARAEALGGRQFHSQ